MNLNKFFELGGLNLWLVASGNGLNFIIMMGVGIGGAMLGASGNVTGQTVLMMLGTFLGPLLVAFICGRMERERFDSYAWATLPGALLPVILAIPSNLLLGLMLAVVAVLGALNGARVAAMTVVRHNH